MKKFVLFIFLIIFSCKTKNFDRTVYYQKVIAIDSALRYGKDTLATIKKYKKLFSKYDVQNHKKYKEYEYYLMLCDKKNISFGSKKNLYKLIDLITPYKMYYKDFSFFKKHGIDSMAVLKRMAEREQKYNKIINDSCETAFYRDQHYRENQYDSITIFNDNKNIKFFRWCLENYGYPSREKIGPLKGNVDFDYIFFRHVISYDYYHELKDDLIQYIKSGECDPYSYVRMVDRYQVQFKHQNKHGPYGYMRALTVLDEVIDSVSINKNRKSIGLPSLRHSSLYRNDTIQILKINGFNTIKKSRNNHQ